VYYEEYDSISDAIYREKCLKKRKREWKDKLIDELNP
jgi:putative endonuclease